MASVKGSKQIQMIVVPQRPWHKWPGKVVLASLLLVALYLVWESGVSQGRNEILASEGGHESDGNGTIGQKITRLVGGEDPRSLELNEKLMRAEQASQVDKLTMQNLRINIQRLREQISLLEEDVLFYKNIATEEVEETGLIISKLDIQLSDQSNHYRYKLRFEQSGRQSQPLQGFANITIAGVQDDAELAIPLNALTNTIQGESIKLRFRSFQDVEGEFALPQGFEPLRVEVLAVSEAPESKTLQRNFSWLVESGQLP